MSEAFMPSMHEYVHGSFSYAPGIMREVA